MYKIVLSKAAAKGLRNADARLRMAIVDKIEKLAANPADVALDIKALQGVEGYRLRVRSWRVLFTRDDSAHIVDIVRIAPRQSAYD